MNKIKGVIAPIITVFNEDESIDNKGTISHVEWLIENGIEGIVVCGSTGESISMIKEERKGLAELIVKEFKNSTHICVGTGCYRTKDTIELSIHAESIGADSLLIIPPYYMGLTKTQIFEHFKEISKHVNIPIILYSNPSASGVFLSDEEVKKYFDLKLIQGIKLTIDDPSHVHILRYLCGNDFFIFYGADLCVLEGLLCGADGWISGIPNLIPNLSRLLCDAALAGERNKATEIWYKMLPLINMETFLDNNREPHWLSFIKSGLESIGRNVGKPRKPILPLNNKHKKMISDVLLKII